MCERRAKNFMWWVLIKSSLLLFLLGCTQKTATSLPQTTLYLASSLMPLKGHLKKSAEKFSINMVFQSSSVIAQQIAAGAPCDAAIVADDTWKNYLIKRKAVEEETHIIAHNSLVVAGNNKDAQTKNIKDLLDNNDKIIIADPDFVPLGSYSKEMLNALGIFDKLEKQLVMAHSAQHAVTLLNQGLAKKAILYASDINNKNIYRLAEVDGKLHKPIFYPFLICKKGNKEHARALLSLLLSPSCQEKLKNAGFRPSS